jgi:hypothetical protein
MNRLLFGLVVISATAGSAYAATAYRGEDSREF